MESVTPESEPPVARVTRRHVALVAVPLSLVALYELLRRLLES